MAHDQQIRFLPISSLMENGFWKLGYVNVAGQRGGSKGSIAATRACRDEIGPAAFLHDHHHPMAVATAVPSFSFGLINEPLM